MMFYPTVRGIDLAEKHGVCSLWNFLYFFQNFKCQGKWWGFDGRSLLAKNGPVSGLLCLGKICQPDCGLGSQLNGRLPKAQGSLAFNIISPSIRQIKPRLRTAKEIQGSSEVQCRGWRCDVWIHMVTWTQQSFFFFSEKSFDWNISGSNIYFLKNN